jgi:hypothetical protein
VKWDAKTSVPIQIAVRFVIGVLVAPVVIAATEPEAAMEASAAMKVISAMSAFRGKRTSL